MDEQTELTRKRYDRIASFFNLMDHMIRSSWRKELLENVQGKILEVGVGTGANMAYYPPSVDVTGVDLSPNMLSRAYKKVTKSKGNITLREMDIQQLDFPDNTFDVVVSTCVFCSVPNPVEGLKEIRRVVKPEGEIVMLEHMRSENLFAGTILDIVNPLIVRVIGANVNRKTIENIQEAGLKIEKQEYLMTSIMRKLIISPNKEISSGVSITEQ